MNFIIEVKNLAKKYASLTAVNNISFGIKQGEIFGFLGPNGAGKTTTINMLIGLARPTEGKIFYKNADVTDKIKKAQEFIGVVADESNLYDELTGFENLCFCGALYGLSRIKREKRAKELLDAFELDSVSAKKIITYSRGMKRKLTIAAALVHEPEILFLDEPTTGIDVSSARQIRSLIKELNSKGTTVFLTTHYIEEAERLCHRISLIKQGSIIRTGTVGELLQEAEKENVVEIACKLSSSARNRLIKDLHANFPQMKCFLSGENTIRISSASEINIVPIMVFLSGKEVVIQEAKLIKPSLEEAFVKITGMEIDVIKKEKEKK